MSRVWIFQGNPDTFNIMGYLRAGLSKITWSVSRYADQMQPGDLVYLWQAQGSVKARSGIIASALIVSPVWQGPDHKESLPYWVKPEEANAIEPRVWLKAERVANEKEIVQRDWLKEDPVCRDLLILRQAAGTNFPVNEIQADRLQALWARTGEDWDRRECVAALVVYEDTRNKSISQKPGSPVAKLALLTGRAVGGAYNKVLNFRAIDPRDDRAGLSGGGSMDREVWKDFYDESMKEVQYDRLTAECDRLWKDATPSKPEDEATFGTDYRVADETIEPSQPQPAQPDPDAVGRGWKEHARTQNALAEFVGTLGAVPRSPQVGDPQFDLCWEKGDSLFVAEVKSTTLSNEERQLRLGLGQVLRYRHITGLGGKNVVAVLAAARAPSDPGWAALCASLDVLLVWPEVFASHLK